MPLLGESLSEPIFLAGPAGSPHYPATRLERKPKMVETGEGKRNVQPAAPMSSPAPDVVASEAQAKILKPPFGIAIPPDRVMKNGAVRLYNRRTKSFREVATVDAIEYLALGERGDWSLDAPSAPGSPEPSLDLTSLSRTRIVEIAERRRVKHVGRSTEEIVSDLHLLGEGA